MKATLPITIPAMVPALREAASLLSAAWTTDSAIFLGLIDENKAVLTGSHRFSLENT